MGRRAGKSRGRGNCSRDVMYERGIKEKNDILLPGVTEHPAKEDLCTHWASRETPCTNYKVQIVPPLACPDEVPPA